MLTKLLHTCGLYLGPENELMPAQANNPDGFWEYLGFVALNDYTRTCCRTLTKPSATTTPASSYSLQHAAVTRWTNYFY
jgi:hypothetical protein